MKIVIYTQITGCVTLVLICVGTIDNIKQCTGTDHTSDLNGKWDRIYIMVSLKYTVIGK
jgi:hypothetical protein